MSVKELVKSEEKKRKEYREKCEREEALEKKKKLTKEFTNNVTKVIKEFEYRFFDINATEEKVAKFLLEDDSSRYLFSSDDGHLKNLVFYSGDKYGDDRCISESKRYMKWKKSIENKFGIRIYIYEDYYSTDRYDNEGYMTYPDKTYVGLKATIYLKDEEE